LLHNVRSVQLAAKPRIKLHIGQEPQVFPIAVEGPTRRLGVASHGGPLLQEMDKLPEMSAPFRTFLDFF
jgi:hypothetical protein